MLKYFTNVSVAD